jgi:hypothetical protein
VLPVMPGNRACQERKKKNRPSSVGKLWCVFA